MPPGRAAAVTSAAVVGPPAMGAASTGAVTPRPASGEVPGAGTDIASFLSGLVPRTPDAYFSLSWAASGEAS
jgi:hypothetical protein